MGERAVGRTKGKHGGARTGERKAVAEPTEVEPGEVERAELNRQ